MSDTSIRTSTLGRDFKTVIALDGLTLEVPAGIVFGFLGPNVAGLNVTAAALAAVSLLAAADAVILLAADARFRRNRLILD